MDPASALGIAGSIVSIVDVASKCISTLRRLQQRWKAADITTNLLVAQLVTLKAALNQIAEWANSSLSDDPKHHQLVIDLGMSLDCCSMLVSIIDNYLETLDWTDEGSLIFESRAKTLLKTAL
ncbi:MAG: hypothetical protein MMC23_005563 [Stictis urceolatum]|nr:hypothetical protein [Stictis urceolata]